MATDNASLRKAIIHNLMQSQEYCQKVLPFLEKDYFAEKSERIVFEEIQKYYNKYATPPKNSAVKIEIESRNDLTDSIYKEVDAYVSEQVMPIPKIDFLVDKTEQWCQERAIVNAVYKAVSVIGGDDKKTQMSALPQLLSDAISTSFDKSVGHDYIEEASDRWEFYNQKEQKIPSGIEHLDYILHGGFPAKTLGVLMAGCVHPSTKIKVRLRK